MPRGNNLKSIQTYVQEMEKFEHELTKKFNPPGSDKVALLTILNDENFLTQIAGDVTYLRYTTYGELYNKDRAGGKKLLTSAVNRGLNRSGSLASKNQVIVDILEKDFGESFEQELEEGFNLQETISDLLKSFFGKIIEKDLKKDIRLERISTGKMEQTVKAFYKALYRNIRNHLKDESKFKNQEYFLEGSLHLGQEFKETEYAQEIIVKIYDQENEGDVFERKGTIKKDLTKKNLSNIIYDFLHKEVKAFKNEILVSQAINYLESHKDSIKRTIIGAYSGLTNEEAIRTLAEFSKSGISGVIGEISTSLSLSSFDPIFISGKKNKLGQKNAVDIKLIVTNGKKHTAVGIQVKNYTSSKNVPLYADTEVALDGKNMLRYMSQKDLTLFKFMVANNVMGSQIFNMPEYSKEALELMLYNYAGEFLRETDLQEDKDYQNSFYYINNRLFPVSLLLGQILENCLEILENAKKEKLFEIINMPNAISFMNSNDKPEAYSQIDTRQQPRANKIINGTTYKNVPAISIKFGSLWLPQRVENVISNTKILFKGIIVET